jgi:ABC-type phosphate transport system substrate-binding protein
MVDFLNWMLGDGQKMVQELNYAPLPQTFREKELAVTKQIH